VDEPTRVEPHEVVSQSVNHQDHNLHAGGSLLSLG
jgi:hypothetical protein